MSDTAIFSDPWSVALLYLIFGSPGIFLGAIVGALVWRTHWLWGALIGALAGWALCIAAVWAWVIK